jgi:ABC-type transporter Mla subunit MlaD
MANFDYLVRKHAKALGLFAKVSAKLKKLEAKIASVMSKSQESITEAQKTIEEHKANLDVLATHLKTTQDSRAQVEQFLPKQPETSRIF